MKPFSLINLNWQVVLALPTFLYASSISLKCRDLDCISNQLSIYQSCCNCLHRTSNIERYQLYAQVSVENTFLIRFQPTVRLHMELGPVTLSMTSRPIVLSRQDNGLPVFLNIECENMSRSKSAQKCSTVESAAKINYLDSKRMY